MPRREGRGSLLSIRHTHNADENVVQTAEANFQGQRSDLPRLAKMLRTDGGGVHPVYSSTIFPLANWKVGKENVSVVFLV